MLENTNRALILLESDLNSIDPRTNTERIRYKMYSVYVNLLINRELFKRNDDIRFLSKELGLDFKDYVYRSRTLLVARYMRAIESANDSNIELLLKTAEKAIKGTLTKNNERSNIKNKKTNYIDKYGR